MCEIFHLSVSLSLFLLYLLLVVFIWMGASELQDTVVHELWIEETLIEQLLLLLNLVTCFLSTFEVWVGMYDTLKSCWGRNEIILMGTAACMRKNRRKNFHAQVHGTFSIEDLSSCWMDAVSHIVVGMGAKLTVHKTLILVRKLLGLYLAYTMDQDSQDVAGR
jgi:hypothetical protein